MNTTRTALMEQWLSETLPGFNNDVHAASSDASFRQYFRIFHQNQSWIVMDAPPDKEDCQAFIDITQRLIKAGLHAPEIHAHNLEMGFILLDDLGQQDYLSQLNADNKDPLYGDALGALRQMQLATNTQGLNQYSEQKLIEEMSLFRDWLLGEHLQCDLSEFDDMFQPVKALLLEQALQQDQVFVHRDYHSRNLMRTAERNPGIIDYQDAVLGPITYDLVSLLRDCYIQWPDQWVYKQIETYRQALQQAGLTQADSATFKKWFDWMGMQRHLKAAGIFARLFHRDHKSGYLKDIPRTVEYIATVSLSYPEFNGLASYLKKTFTQTQAL